MDIGDYGMDANPFSMGFGLDGAYDSGGGGGAWDAGDTGENPALGTYGMDQSTLEKLWNKMGVGNQFQSQGSHSWDQVSQYGSNQQAGQALGNSRWMPDGDSNPENDFFISQNSDGGYGLTNIMRHGWNGEFASMIARVFAPMVFGDGGILSQAGGTATGAGTELGAEFGSNLGSGFDAFSGGFGLGGADSGFDAALGALGSSAPAVSYGADEFAEEGLGKTPNMNTASGGGIGGGINNGTQLQGGSGNASPEQNKLQQDFLKYAGNEIKPGAGNLLATGDKAMSEGNGLFGSGLTGQDLMQGLQTLYGMSQANKGIGQTAKTLGNMYGQNSPYAEELRKQLQRRDAASGRRSQYGPREVELQAKLAGQYSQNAPHLMNAQNQAGANRMAMMTNMMGLGMKALPMLQRLWGQGEQGQQQGGGMGGGLTMPQFGQMPQGSNAFDQGFGMNQPLDGGFDMGFGMGAPYQSQLFGG